MFVSIYYKPRLFNAHTMILIVHIVMNVNKLCLNQTTIPIWVSLFIYPTRASSCLDLSCSLPPPFPPPSPYPYASIYIQLPHRDTDFFRFYRKAWANKVFSCDLNWDSVGTFLRVAGREFQRDGAMKLKERCPNDLRFRFGIFSSFSLEDRRERDGS